MPTSTVGSIWLNRSTRLVCPKSGEQLDQTAPMEAVARNATSACSELGRTAHTRSPGPTPSLRRPAAARPTASRSPSQLRVRARPSSRRAITAVPAPACRRAFSA